MTDNFDTKSGFVSWLCLIALSHGFVSWLHPDETSPDVFFEFFWPIERAKLNVNRESRSKLHYDDGKLIEAFDLLLRSVTIRWKWPQNQDQDEKPVTPVYIPPSLCCMVHVSSRDMISVTIRLVTSSPDPTLNGARLKPLVDSTRTAHERQTSVACSIHCVNPTPEPWPPHPLYERTSTLPQSRFSGYGHRTSKEPHANHFM